MTDTALVRTVKSAGVALKVIAWLVLIVGLVLAGALVWSGYDTVEPWAYAGILAETERESMVWGWISGAFVFVWSLAGWAVLGLLGGWASHLAYRISRHGAGYVD